MDWAIDEAQQRFLELIDAAVEEPQLIRDRDRYVMLNKLTPNSKKGGNPPAVNQPDLSQCSEFK
jgi:hypothetical protein